MCSKTIYGFTLAELLIALAILGVIATFTIPKILSSQQNGEKVAKAKEVAGMISTAYQQLQLGSTITSGTKPSDLIPYLNYVKQDTSGTVIDAVPGYASYTCNASSPCLWLHNGGVLWCHSSSFGGTSSLNVMEFVFDPAPNNNTTSTSDGPLKAVQFGIYYNGFLTSRGQFKVGSAASSGALVLDPNYDPSWFIW
jgi:prepilin-type N-terminal cleavage/methylation domain-containing protein